MHVPVELFDRINFDQGVPTFGASNLQHSTSIVVACNAPHELARLLESAEADIIMDGVAAPALLTL